MSVFGAPQGLLGTSSSFPSDTNALGRDTIEGDGFEPNGLLAQGAFTLESLLGQTSVERAASVEPSDTQAIVPDQDDAFRSNGLLSVTSASTSSEFIPTGILSAGSSTQQERASVAPILFAESQEDEEFPEVEDLLRPYDTNTASASTILMSTSSGWGKNIVRASTFEGKPHFIGRRMRRSQRSTTNTSASSSGRNDQRFSTLLDTPIHRLLEDLARTTATKLAQLESEPPASNLHQSPDNDNSLWVDRYRPQRFTDLLGDDRVHREVMAWVKEWEWCVFGRRKAGARGVKRARTEDGDAPPDEWKRPKEKLLLLSGPPGLGKTTLAHIVAKHAGYSVFEVNASDARSAQVVDERIRPALETGYTVGSPKPILVVIDEIDGATGGTDNSGGFIQKLIQLTYDKPRKKGRKAEPQVTRPLLRPIICICNDLYASSLAKLRQHARIVRFSRPNDLHLVRRLRDICATEGLQAESRALTTLVGVSQGDLRGCLNTLQMMKARNEHVTVSVIREATRGMKEEETSHVTILNDLFSPMSRKRALELGLNEEEEAKYVSRLSREVEGSDAMDKIAIGCLEHYAMLGKHDSTFARQLKATEWLVTFDMMSSEMRAEREYAMLQYLPYTLVSFYPLFQDRGAPRVERPKADWENYTQTKANEEIYKAFARGLRAAAARLGGDYRHLAHEQVLRLEVAPFINRIISPPLRPVHSQVVRPSERLVLSRLVDIMVALDLRFIQEKAEDGQLVYRLDPPIDVFVTYDGKRTSDISLSRYAVRHLVATEIETRLASRKDVVGATSHLAAFGKSARVDDMGDIENISGEGMLLRAANSSTPANKRQKIELIEKVAVDFFGRPIVPKGPKNHDGAQEKHVAKKYVVAYRFREGNSAAVRKPVKVGAFL